MAGRPGKRIARVLVSAHPREGCKQGSGAWPRCFGVPDSGHAMPSTSEPLVSIISFCKDRATTMRRSIDSVLSQSYRKIEFVVQDGASTDGTLEILCSYDDPRIRLVSEPDSGPAEAFWKVLHRCQGAIIGTCLSDEELLPGAVGRAVALFAEHPEIGAATCDGYTTDVAGNIKGPFTAGAFNLVDYLFGRYCPFWPGSFFRREALLDVGLDDDDWSIGALEFEIWCRLGTRHTVRSFPIPMSKYAIADTQLSQTAKAFNEHMDNRVRIVEQMFSERGFAGRDEAKKVACLYNQRYLFYNHVRAYKMYDQMEAMYRQMLPLLRAAGDAAWARAVVKDDTPAGLQAFSIPETYYADFERLLQRRRQ
jgi:glycosyltransferase involved in cell wall biosynthesis